MQVWKVMQAARWKYRTQKSPSWHHRITCWAISLQLRSVSTIGKKLLSSNISCRCPHNMVSFGPLTAEISSVVWGTPANFNGFRILAALPHTTLVVGISQTWRHWTEGTTYIWQGGHHIGTWPTLYSFFPRLISAVGDWMSTILPHMVWP